MKIKSYLPVFNGFYNTLFSCNSEDMVIDYYNEDNNTDFEWDDFEWNYIDYNNRVGKKCTEVIENNLTDFNIKVKFESIESPRQYNFENDVIYVTYEIDKIRFLELKEYLKNNIDAFQVFIKDRYSSYDGFVSFWEADSNVWLNKYLNFSEDNTFLSHCFGAVLEFYFENERFSDEDLVDLVSEELLNINFKLS